MRTWLASDIDLSNAIWVVARWACVLTCLEWREVRGVLAFRTNLGRIALVAGPRAKFAGAPGFHFRIWDLAPETRWAFFLAGRTGDIQEISVLANLAHFCTGAFHTIVGTSLTRATNLFSATFPVASWTFIVALPVRRQIREIFALTANICRVALVAGVEATRTRSTRLKAAAESVEAVRTFWSTTAVGVQVAENVAFKAHVWT